MATCSETDLSVFDQIAHEIFLTFGNIIETATKRRDQLLAELNEMRIEFEERIKTQIADLKELEQMREQIMQMCVKQNTVLKIQEASLVPIEQQISNLEKISIKEPDLSFEYLESDFLEKLTQLGTIVSNRRRAVEKKMLAKALKINYSSKIKSKRTIGSWPENNQTPNQIHVSRNGQLVFLPNVGTHSVNVYGVESGEQLREFGQGILIQPYAVTTDEKFCFVTDFNRHKIFQFNIGDYNLLNSTDAAGGSNEYLSRPAGITCNGDELYVVDQGNHRVCLYCCCDLKYITELGSNVLKAPKDIKIFNDEIYVLDPKHCLHSFSLSGDYIKSVLTCGSGMQLTFPTSFCMDQDGNIIIADHEDKALKVFSNEGELIRRFGEEDSDTEEIGYCFGVAVSGDSIFLSSFSFKFIKVF